MVGVDRVSCLTLDFDSLGHAGLGGCAVGQPGSNGEDVVAVKTVVRKAKHIAVKRAENGEQRLAALPFVFGDLEAALQILGVNFDEFYVFIAVNGWVEAAS